MSFTPVIGSDEELKFVATYDRATANVNVIPGFPGGNLGQFLKICGLSNSNFISINFTSSSTGVPGAPSLANETYSVVSYDKTGKLGSLIWSGLYPELLTPDGTTPPSIQQFVVIGSSGIFSNINKVIVDYNNLIRVCYFVGPKEVV